MAKIDTHMGSVMHPQLLPAYVRLAVEYRVPLMLPRLSEEEMARWGMEAIGDSAANAGLAGARIADYRTFLRPELKAYIAEQGIHLIGYRRLRDLIRGEL